MATDDNISKFNKLIEECLQTTTADLIHSSDWGSFNFEDIEAEVNKLFQMLNHFKTLPIELLPKVELNKLVIGLEEPNIILEQIRTFSIEQQNPKGIRYQLASRIKTAIDNFYTIAHLWIPYLAYQKGDVQKNIEELNVSVKNASFILDKTKKDVQTKKEEIDNIVFTAKEAAASVGVNHFSTNFEKEAKIHKTNAAKWLWTTAILAGSTLLSTIIIYFAFPIVDNATMAQIVQVLSTKIILISILFTATLWAGKMYKATIHQMIMNKHRSNSLKTFQTFTKASNDITTRDAVLMETTKSIFSIIPSGYIDNERSGATNSTNIIEVIKNSSDIIKSE
jgi:transposase-like protein